MSKKGRKNKKKQGWLSDYLEACPITDIAITRYTFDAWIKCYPDSSREEYEEKHFPHNLLDYLCHNFALDIEALKKHPDLRIKFVLIDDDYFKWLGNRTDTSQTRTEYTTKNPYSEEEMTAKQERNHLNVSEWMYALPLSGIIKRPLCCSQMDMGTVELLEKYYTDVIHGKDFSVYVAPYIMKCDDYFNSYVKILSMAESWFNQRNRVKLPRFASIKFKNGVNAAMLNIPVIVRQTHQGACLTASEILAYIGEDADVPFEQMNAGQYLHWVDFIPDEGYDGPEAFAAKQSISGTEAGKAVAKEYQSIFLEMDGIEEGLRYLIDFKEIPEFYEEFIDSISDEFRQSGKIIHCI